MLTVAELRKPRRIRIEGQHVARQIVIKVHGWCNLNCSYCYMYNMADQSWRKKSKTMSTATARIVVRRVIEYVREHNLSAISIILHGGEPFLNMKVIRIIARLKLLLPGVAVDISAQTNATVLTRSIANECLRLGIAIGVSMDGDVEDNSLRLYHNGRSSHADALRGLKILLEPKYRVLLDAVLCYARYDRDPVKVFDYLAGLGDFPQDHLRPLGNWTNPPPGIVTVEDGFNPYAAYYCKLFDHWVEREMSPPILLFQKILQLLAAEYAGIKLPWYENIEMIGPWIMGAIAIDVDGNYAMPDWFMSVKEGEDSFGLNVREDIMTRALFAILMLTDERGIVEGSPDCQSCDIYSVCGAGLPSERAKIEGDTVNYLNASVYCGDLQELIYHIIKRVTEAAPDSLLLAAFTGTVMLFQERHATQKEKV